MSASPIIWAIAATGAEPGRLQELRNRLGFVPLAVPDRFEARLQYVARVHGERVVLLLKDLLKAVRAGPEYSLLLVWLGDRIAAVLKMSPPERRGVINQLTRHLPEILDWARSVGPNLGQYDVAAAVAEQAAWHESLLELGVGPSPGRVVMRLPDGWTVEALTTRAQLQAEGAALQHCVGSYHTYVQQGTSFIYSLRREGAPVLTAEIVEPAVLRQVHGLLNRGPTRAELDRFNQFLLPELERRAQAYAASLVFNERISLPDGFQAVALTDQDFRRMSIWDGAGVVKEGRAWLLTRVDDPTGPGGASAIRPLVVQVPRADGSDPSFRLLSPSRTSVSPLELHAMFLFAEHLRIQAPVWGRALQADPDLIAGGATWVQVDPVNALEERALLVGPVKRSKLSSVWPEALVISLRAGPRQRPMVMFVVDPFHGELLGVDASALIDARSMAQIRKRFQEVLSALRRPGDPTIQHLLGQPRPDLEASDLPTLGQLRAMVDAMQPRRLKTRILTDDQVALFEDTCRKGLAMARLHGIDPGRLVVEASAGGHGLLTSGALETSTLRLQAGRVVATRDEVVDAERRTGHGKGFRIEVRFRLLKEEAPPSTSLPLRWTLRGGVAWRRGDRMDRP